MYKLVLIFLLLFAQSCPTQPEKSTTVDVLFVGNSLTYYNELPLLVQEILLKKGKHISVEQITEPNYSLEDHWVEGIVQQKIKSRTFELVIVQQGPSSQLDGKTMLVEYGKRLSRLCESNEATLAFYVVWPAISNYHTFDGVISNYSAAADSSKALLFNVGKNLKAHIDSTQDFSFYSGDGFHPSAEGSRFAAEIIAESMLQFFFNEQK